MARPRIPVVRPNRVHLQQGFDLLTKFSGFLIGGTVLALFLANTNEHLYHQLAPHGLHFLVNEVLMTLFFFMAAKEIREAMLPGGKLASLKAAALPLLATVGGMAGPASIYLLGSWLFSPELSGGWAIPMATDIAFSALGARIIFGSMSHPAVVFLLLLAIADDAGGLLILAFFYPVEPLNLAMLLLIAAAVGISMVMYKVLKVKSFWWYLLIPGVISWTGFYQMGIHPALALVPLAWCMPHEKSEEGAPFQEKTTIVRINGEEAERHKTDTLNEFEHWAKNPVELILGLFGFVNAGIVFSSVGFGTGLVLIALVVGKPLGIVLFTKIGLLLGLELPEGMVFPHVVIDGILAGIGFTVALFVATVAFTPGPIQDQVKMGALISIVALLAAFGAAFIWRPRERYT